jgi:predicted nucleic acid-binding Zn ribbon protein
MRLQPKESRVFINIASGVWQPCDQSTAQALKRYLQSQGLASFYLFDKVQLGISTQARGDSTVMTDLYLYTECPDCKRRIRHYVKGLSIKNVSYCPKCGAKIETTLNTLVKALLKLESVSGDFRSHL